MKRLLSILMCLSGLAYGETASIVPRVAHEGSLGTADKPWAKLYVDDHNIDAIDSATYSDTATHARNSDSLGHHASDYYLVDSLKWAGDTLYLFENDDTVKVCIQDVDSATYSDTADVVKGKAGYVGQYIPFYGDSIHADGEKDFATTDLTREATITVAAHNTHAWSKALADFVCDGDSDEVEINEALDSLPSYGGVVRLLEGEYNIVCGITIDDYQSLIGNGYGTHLRAYGTGCPNRVLIANGGDTDSFVVIANMRLNGRDSPGAGYTNGISSAFYESRFENLWIDSCVTVSEGITISAGGHNKIHNCFISRCDYGIWLMRVDNNVITNCKFNDLTARGGILLSDANHNVIIANDFDTDSFMAISFADSCCYNMVSGNSIKGVGNLINFAGSSPSCSNNNSIIGNRIYTQGSGRAGINIGNEDHNYNKIIGNVFITESGSHGMTIGANADSTVIAGNSFYPAGVVRYADYGTNTIIAPFENDSIDYADHADSAAVAANAHTVQTKDTTWIKDYSQTIAHDTMEVGRGDMSDSIQAHASDSLSLFLRRDGTASLTGDLTVDDVDIRGIETVEADTVLISERGYTGAIDPDSAIVTKKYVDDNAGGGDSNFIYCGIDTLGAYNDGQAYLDTDLKTDRWLSDTSNTMIGISVAGADNLAHSSGSEGWYNSFYGCRAGYAITSGHRNVFNGYQAGAATTTGRDNVYSGYKAGAAGTNASENVLIGYQAAYQDNASGNVFIGYENARAHLSGDYNVVIGKHTFLNNTSGSYNTVLGTYASYANTSGNSNIFIGFGAGGSETGSNKVFIDPVSRANEAVGRTDSWIYGITAAATADQYIYLNSHVFVRETFTGTSTIRDSVKFDATQTTDTVVVSGGTTTDFYLLTWRGSTCAAGPLSCTAGTDTVFVYCCEADTAKARSEGFTWFRVK